MILIWWFIWYKLKNVNLEIILNLQYVRFFVSKWKVRLASSHWAKTISIGPPIGSAAHWCTFSRWLKIYLFYPTVSDWLFSVEMERKVREPSSSKKLQLVSSYQPMGRALHWFTFWRFENKFIFSHGFD